MKKYYFGLKIKLLLMLTVLLILGCIVITYEKADRIKESHWNRMYEFRGEIQSLRLKNAYEDKDFIQQIYTAYNNAKSFSEAGFYSMVKSREDNSTIAEFQNFLIVQKCEGNELVGDRRIILLEDDFFTSKDKGGIYFLDSSCSSVEIIGACDDTYIYVEELRWTDTLGENSYSYVPKEKVIPPAGAIKFEEWAGSTHFYDQSEPYYYVWGNHMYSLWGNTRNEEQAAKEAEKVCNQIYEDIQNGTITQDDQGRDGLFTCVVAQSCYLGDDYAMPFAYVFHPVRMAVEELAELFLLIGIIWVVMIFVISGLINKVQKQQQSYENNRLNLTRGVAHELKTPLAITKGYVENWEYVEEADRHQYAQSMIREIEHMNDMVTDLLELSRLEAKRKEIHPEDVDLYALSQSVLKRLDSLVAEKGLTVTDDTDKEKAQTDAFLINADLEMIRTVMVNFITNAVKYAEKNVSICITDRDKLVRFTVINDGKSIALDKTDSIWDEFYIDSVSEGSTGTAGEGKRLGSTGLGLAIAKNILVLHKAKYGCESKDGRTEFWFEMSKF